MLWSSVLAEDHQPLGDRTDFLPFVKTLERACGGNIPTSVKDSEVERGTLSPQTLPPQSPALDAPPAAVEGESLQKPSSAPVAVPGVASEARGIPGEVLRGLAELVISATVCRRCGQRLSSSPASDACCKHETEERMSWWPALPTSEEEVFGSNVVATFPLAEAAGAGSRIVGDGETEGDLLHAAYAMAGGRGRDVAEGEDVAGGANAGGGLMRRRESLVGTLRALDVSTRWSHMREELARWGRSDGEGGGGGGGLAKGLAFLLDCLDARVAALAQRQNGRFRRGRSALEPKTGR